MPRYWQSAAFKGNTLPFESAAEVLEQLTGRQMETLLRRLMDEPTSAPEAVNPAFDQERFRALEKG